MSGLEDVLSAVRLADKLEAARATMRAAYGSSYEAKVGPARDLILALHRATGNSPLALAQTAAESASAEGDGFGAVMLLCAGLEAAEALP